MQWVKLGALGHSMDIAIMPGIRKPASTYTVYIQLSKDFDISSGVTGVLGLLMPGFKNFK